MSRTAKGGKSPVQVARRRGRQLQRQQEQRYDDFKALQPKKPRPKGPVKRG